MDVATEKVVVIRMTEDEAAGLFAELALISANNNPRIGQLWQMLDDLL